MKGIILSVFLFLSFLGIAQGEKDQATNLFENANKSYSEENYSLAIVGYNEILKTGKHSVEVYFNLGNAHYKMNEVGPSIYNFEKALQLDPENEDVLNNLKFANRMKMDDVDSLPENAIGSRVDSLVGSLSVDNWAYVSIVIVLITILLAILYLYAGTPGKKRLFFILMFIGVIFSALSIAAAFYAKDKINNEQFAIVFTEEFKARTEPKLSAEGSFVIHEGTKVEIISEFESWYEIRLANGSKAWMPADAVKKL
jgi:tetratricopeptide (TPR) repeat protein